MSRIFSTDDNTIAVTRQLLKLLKVKTTNTTLSKTLEEHPDYPTLLSIADTLRTLEVKNMGLKISFEQLIKLPRPLLVHQKTNQLLLVTEINDKFVTYSNEHHKRKQLRQKEFLNQWDGMALLATEKEHSGEADYVQKRRQAILQRLYVCLPLILLAALILTILTAISHRQRDGISSLLPFLLSMSGMIASSLLLWYELDKNNPVLQKICAAGKHANCPAILQSGTGNIWGDVHVVLVKAPGVPWYDG